MDRLIDLNPAHKTPKRIYSTQQHRFSPLPEITEDDFLKALNVLPPVGWTKRSDSESFKISERLYGSITAIYARIGDRYYTFSDNITLPHDDVISRIKQSLQHRER